LDKSRHSVLELLQQDAVPGGSGASGGSAAREFDVVGLGVSTVDLIMGVNQFPSDEFVQRAHYSLLQGGGPVATALVTLARLGCRTAMLDKLGDDWRGKFIFEEFEREGVATNHLLLAKGRTSSVASILVRKDDGARTIIYSPGDVEELSPSELSEQLIAACRILHLNGRHLETCLASARLAKRHGVLVSLDGGAHRFHEPLRELISLTDICIVARQFAYAFSGEDDLQASAAKLLQAGPGIVVITGGTEGSWAFHEAGGCFHQEAFKAGSTVDTTGAGDAYHGAFLYGVINNYSLRECTRLASAVAALNTQKIGGRSALPSLQDTMKFLDQQQV